MIDGCVSWQELGLAPPKSVTDATTAYLESEDELAAWMEEACEREILVRSRPRRICSLAGRAGPNVRGKFQAL